MILINIKVCESTLFFTLYNFLFGRVYGVNNGHG